MIDVHFFAGVFAPGATRWSLAFRTDDEAAMERWHAAWPGVGSVLFGSCRAGVSMAKLVKELRRLPAPSSDRYSFFVARLAARVGRPCADVLHFDVVGGEWRARAPASEALH